MKKILMAVIAVLICSSSFAASNLYKGSPTLKALGDAWKTQATASDDLMKNDITIVYGGSDMTNHPTLA